MKVYTRCPNPLGTEIARGFPGSFWPDKHRPYQEEHNAIAECLCALNAFME